METFDVTQHSLVPLHELLTDEEKEKLFEKYNISIIGLPKIFKNDAAIAHLNVKVGDVIKITRNSPTAKTSVYYRGVFLE